MNIFRREARKLSAKFTNSSSDFLVGWSDGFPSTCLHHQETSKQIVYDELLFARTSETTCARCQRGITLWKYLLEVSNCSRRQNGFSSLAATFSSACKFLFSLYFVKLKILSRSLTTKLFSELVREWREVQLRRNFWNFCELCSCHTTLSWTRSLIWLHSAPVIRSLSLAP